MNKWSTPYQILRIYGHLVHSAFYKKIIVKGKNNIPKDKPVIFAPNHQNALMDPMGVLFTQKRQTIFLTRADIFNNPILLKIFTFLKMLPVYRIRDGAESLQNNERIFNQSVKILESKDQLALALFPEARHTDKRALLPLKKAVPRIAFRALEQNNYDLDVQIVPVGIYYSEYTPSQSTLQINYGKPIAVKDFEAIYKDNNQKGMAALKDRIAEGIKEEIIHIGNTEHYDTFEFVRKFNRKTMLAKLGLNKNDFVQADKETIQRLDKCFEEEKQTFNQIEELSNKIKEKAKEINIHWESEFNYSLGNFLLTELKALIAIPIFLYAFVNHFIWHRLIKSFVNKKLKDKQFHSSIKFGFAIIGNLIIFPIQAGIFAIFLPEFFWYYLISLPISAWLGLKAKYALITWSKEIKIWNRRTFAKKAFTSYTDLKEQLATLLQKI
jgi:1-acyl-sn-glycerol-3-phosphate acyltransferase